MIGARISWIPVKIHLKTRNDAYAFILQTPDQPIPNDIENIYLTGNRDCLMVIHHGCVLEEINDKAKIDKIIQYFSGRGRVDKNNSSFVEIAKMLACLSNDTFHYGFTYESNQNQGNVKNFYYYEKLPTHRYTDSMKLSTRFASQKAVHDFQEELLKGDFERAAHYLVSPKLKFVLNGSPALSQEFHADMPFTRGAFFSHDYTFPQHYEPIHLPSRLLYRINYQYDIYAKDFSSEKMGTASLNFKKAESAQDFIEGIAESNLNKIISSLNDTDETTRENAKKVKELFKTVNQDALLQHSLFSQPKAIHEKDVSLKYVR